MNSKDWEEELRRALGMQTGNESIEGHRFLLLMNASPDDVRFHLSAGFPAQRFVHIFDTRLPDGIVREKPQILAPGGVFLLEGRSLALFQHEVATLSPALAQVRPQVRQ